ncbi:MAG: septum site-determining protein MinC [bacterium]
MQELKIKRVKKEIFLDLSGFDIKDKGFTKKIEEELNRSASFFSGNAVSIILPELDNTEADLEISEQIKAIQSSLNKNNVSLKASYLAGDMENILHSNSETEPSSTNQKIENITDEELNNDQEYNIPETLYVKSGLRAGHLIRYPGNVIIYGDVNPSAEIIAEGDVIIWGTCRGIVHAGSNRDKNASISALKFNNCQLRISESNLDLSRNNIKTKSYKNNFFHGAELAKLENDEIIIYIS